MDKRKYPPAIQRYRKTHPTISAVLTDTLKARLDGIKGERTYSQIIKDLIIGAFQPVEEYAKKLEESNDTIHTKNIRIAHLEARIKLLENELNKYKITYPCNMCGGELLITVNNKDLLADIRKCLKEKGWGHGECHERED